MKFVSLLLPILAPLLVSAAPIENGCLTADQANNYVAQFFTVYEGGAGLDDFAADNIIVVDPVRNHNSLDALVSGKEAFRSMIASLNDESQTRYTNVNLANEFVFSDCQNIAVLTRIDFTVTAAAAQSPSANTVQTAAPAGSQQRSYGINIISVDVSTGLVNVIRNFFDEVHFLGLQGIDPISIF